MFVRFTKYLCSEISLVNSGWNATPMTLFFLTATIFSLNFDKTSTSVPTSEMDGALMKTPLNVGIPIEFREISDSVGAYLLVDMAHIAGLVAAGCYPNPVPIADVTTSTTHKTLRGPRGGIILARKNEEIEKAINKQVFPGTQGGPLMHVIAAKAHAFKEAMAPEFKNYQKQVISNAQLMASLFQKNGYQIVSGGTDCHLFLVDLMDKDITGADAEFALGQSNITLNKNSVPNDKRSPMVTSGLRIGTPAITTRGFREEEIKMLVKMMIAVLSNIEDKAVQLTIRKQVLELCEKFPVYTSR